MQAGYRLVSYADSNGAPVAGILAAGRVVPATSILGARFSSVMEILRFWDETNPRLAKACEDKGFADKGTPLASIKLLAPLLYPGAFYCAGANYWDHLNEMAAIAKQTTGRDVHITKPAEPWFFLKTAAGSIIGDGAPARLPNFSKQVDWEAEIGAVIARPTRNISEKDALSAVAGYLIVNDLSARDLMKREGSIFVYDWIGQKCFEDAAPMGPWLTPTAYISDPNNLSIKLWVNGVLKQDSNTSKMVHNTAEQIAYLSRHITLQPGDVIATGTPAGVGLPKGEFLKPGDEVKIEIAELGTLTNKMVADFA
ncbi:fumarylacetoacetate hydrolase family protein [Pseudorhodoplanes sp.]|uniref:fumarylacetoacetate hydrolase family protein n=1 Tax=Pseudorhodoplanes sp. TaxID=1934341 RepID=UPI002C810713|nr:fumarylacetoacetate hydrolase family protein [Pseudorhodoplanes sp.]HWV53124.1 fumarylacetoacetate hydrolase family protein [Pseudorhodoplanes sp.]